MYTNTHKYEPEKREAVGGGNKATSEDGMAWEKGGTPPNADKKNKRDGGGGGGQSKNRKTL